MSEIKKINVIALGTDPEFFIRDIKNEKFVSVEGLIGGTKDAPLQFTEEGHALQEDNVMLEVCVPPAVDAETMYNNIQITINEANKRLAEINENYQIVVLASAEFYKEELMSEQASRVGCDPDRNAWFDMDNPIPELPETIRFAGGHIHVSYVNHTEELNIELVKAMDLFLGVPAVLMDIDDRRKEIYGTPGRYRTKKYGVEYRTLSNFWTESLENVQWMFNQVEKAIEYVNSGKKVDERIPVCIDTNNKNLAKELCEEFKIDYYATELQRVFIESVS